MKRILLLLLAAGVLPAAQQAVSLPAPASITITNPSATTRNGEVVEIPYEQVSSFASGDFKLVNKQTGKEVPYQLAYEGGKQPKWLLVQVSVPAHGSIVINAAAGKPAAITPRTYGRYVPERKDDFAWENDRVAFRMYGKALEGFPAENAHGIDVWAKRTTDLVVDKWYRLNDYHHDNGEGLDYYAVGLTLGGGDIAPFINDSICFPLHYRTWKVLDNGPLRTTFQLGYEAWKAGDISVSVVKTISLDAGSQLNKMQIQYSAAVPVVAGIVKRAAPGSMWLNEKTGVIGYWEPQHGEDGIIGLGIVMPAHNGMLVTKQHLLAKGKASDQEPFVYYTGAAWNKAGRFTSAEQWFAYLEAFAGNLQQPLQVKVD